MMIKFSEYNFQSSCFGIIIFIFKLLCLSWAAYENPYTWMKSIEIHFFQLFIKHNLTTTCKIIMSLLRAQIVSVGQIFKSEKLPGSATIPSPVWLSRLYSRLFHPSDHLPRKAQIHLKKQYNLQSRNCLYQWIEPKGLRFKPYL